MKNVILVEDNRIEVRNISQIIENIEGCKLLGSFPNGLKGMEFLQSNDVDIVITDVQMPKMNGIEFAKKIREEKIDVEIIIISGYQDFDNAKSAVGLDIVDYVMKPILNDELDISIKKAISRCNEKQNIKTDYEKLKEQIESSKQLLCEQFIRSLIINPEVSDAYIKSNQEIFNINLIDGHKMLFIIKLKENDYKDTLVTLYAIMDYILKYKSNNISIFPFMMNENEVGAIAVSDDYKELVPQIIKLKNMIRNDYEVNLIVGLSSADTNLRNINRQYQECKTILKEIKNSWNIVVMCEEADEDYAKNNIFVQMQSKVRKYILEGDIAGINKFLEDNLRK